MRAAEATSSMRLTQTPKLSRDEVEDCGSCVVLWKWRAEPEMGKRGHSKEEILRVLREAESGDTVVEIYMVKTTIGELVDRRNK
jgi:hypothetical protein